MCIRIHVHTYVYTYVFMYVFMYVCNAYVYGTARAGCRVGGEVDARKGGGKLSFSSVLSSEVHAHAHK